METRTIKELLQVLLDNEKYFKDGLCELTSDLMSLGIIGAIEKIRINNFIKKNAPKRYIGEGMLSAYSWEFGEWPPRKEWIEQQIKSFKNI